MKAVLDRIVDGTHAVLLVGEDEEELILQVSALPGEAKAGAVYEVTLDNGTIRTIQLLDPDAAQENERRIASKLDLLRQRSGSRFRS